MSHRRACQLLALISSAVLAHPAHAQGPADGPQRLWLELGLGGSRQSPNCAACLQQSDMGGLTGTISSGLTITARFGVALLAREFTEFSFDYSHSARYYLALAQFSPAPQRVIQFNLGMGVGQQHGDNPPYGDNGSGTAIAAGVALRAPSSSIVGLTLTADLIKTITGGLPSTRTRLGSSYRPLLITIGVGLNMSARSETTASSR